MTNHWPDWKDIGKRVSIELANGTVIVGELKIDDVGFDGEDEYPIFQIEADDGSEHSFADEVSWRFIT